MNTAAIASLHQHLLAALHPAPTETRRLFHGRGRCYPGLEHLTVDWLQGVLLVALFRQPSDAELAALKQMLMTFTQTANWQHSQAHSLLLQHRYLLESTTEWLLGEVVDECLISENGLRYKLDLGQKQNSGLFLDMRYGRQWVHAQARGLRVLNLFAYTCGLDRKSVV